MSVSSINPVYGGVALEYTMQCEVSRWHSLDVINYLSLWAVFIGHEPTIFVTERETVAIMDRNISYAIHSA